MPVEVIEVAEGGRDSPHEARVPGSLPAGSFDGRRARSVLVGLTLATVAAVVLFMTWDLQGSLGFALTLRGRKVAAMLLVGCGLGTSSVLFHTISGNRILTPSLLGFDRLYIFVQTSAAFLFGTFVFLAIDRRIRFAFELIVMVVFALTLNRVLLRRAVGDLPLLLLAGVVMGSMFASLS